MNNSESAQKGFKTFILTLSISLMVFSAVYYFLSTYSPDKSNGATPTQIVADTTVVNASVKGASTEKVTPTDPVQAEAPASVFGAIASKKPQGRAQAVLAETTQASQSTTIVPSTGVTEISLGLALSFGLFLAAIVFTSMNPRKMALKGFEKQVLKNSK
jgi:hypothetical protein